jgi:hypothetical protein
MYLNNNVIFTFVISMILRFPARNAQIKVHKLVVNACTDYFLNLERDGLLASSIYFISFYFKFNRRFNFYFGCLFWFFLSNGNSTANLSSASFVNVASTRASTRGLVFGAFRVDVVTRQTRRHSPSRVTRTRQTRRYSPSRVSRTRQTRRHSPSRVARTRQTREIRVRRI